MSSPVQANALTAAHKYLRLELFEVARLLSRAAPADCAEVHAALKEVTALLHRHGEQEDRLLEPQLRAINPALANHMAEDHRELEQQLKTVQVLSEDLEPGQPAQCARGLAQLHLEWMRFIANYLLHLDDEERLLFPALDLAPVAALAETALAQPSAAQEKFLVKLSLALNPSEYREVVIGLQQERA